VSGDVVRIPDTPSGDVYRLPVYMALGPFLNGLKGLPNGRFAEISGTTLREVFHFPVDRLDELRRPLFDLMAHPTNWLGTYDLVFADWVLEHVADPFAAVRHIRDMLKPGGWACLTTAFLFPIHEAADHGDYWRFSPTALLALFSGWDEVRAGGWGSRLAAERVLDWLQNNHSVETMRELAAAPNDYLYPVMTWVTARRP